MFFLHRFMHYIYSIFYVSLDDFEWFGFAFMCFFFQMEVEACSNPKSASVLSVLNSGTSLAILSALPWKSKSTIWKYVFCHFVVTLSKISEVSLWGFVFFWGAANFKTNCEGHIPRPCTPTVYILHIIDIIIAAVSLNFLFLMDQTMQIDQIVC